MILIVNSLEEWRAEKISTLEITVSNDALLKSNTFQVGSYRRYCQYESCLASIQVQIYRIIKNKDYRNRIDYCRSDIAEKLVAELTFTVNATA